MHIGCHLSTSGGYVAMGNTALKLGADTLQFFTRNPRGGDGRIPSDEEISSLVQLMREHSFAPAVAHASYTLNICSATPATREFAKRTMRSDLELLNRFPAGTVVYNFHPGSHTGQGIEEGIRLIVEGLNEVLTEEIHTPVLLETMSGKGSEVGGRFEELAEIIAGVRLQEKMGVCLDTCHIFSAGYDLVNSPEDVLAEFDRIIGLNRLHAVHLNDSMTPFSSKKDRHEKLGAGSLGFEALWNFARLDAVRELPLVLETPNELDGYAAEIARMRAGL